MINEISEYGFQRPMSTDLVASLGQVLCKHEVDAVLDIACRELEMPGAQLDALQETELMRLTEVLTRQRGLVSIIARSFSIRLQSFSELDRSYGRA